MQFDGLMEFLKAQPALIPTVMFVVTLGEAIVFTSPLVPATVLCLAMAGLHQAAGGHFETIVVAAVAGTFLGDLLSYWIGCRYRDSIGGWWVFRRNPEWLPRAVVFFRKWGAAGLLGSKFLGPVRWFGPTVCGVLLMPRTQFLAVTAVASLIWAVAILGPPYYGVKALGS